MSSQIALKDRELAIKDRALEKEKLAAKAREAAYQCDLAAAGQHAAECVQLIAEQGQLVQQAMHALGIVDARLLQAKIKSMQQQALYYKRTTGQLRSILQQSSCVGYMLLSELKEAAGVAPDDNGWGRPY